MPFYADNFDGANTNPLPSPFTTISGQTALKRASNEARGTAASDTTVQGMYYNDTTGDDQFSMAQILEIPDASCDAAVICRCQTAARTYYELRIAGVLGGNLTVTLFYINAGTANTIQSTTRATRSGDYWWITAIGTSIKGYQNGVEILSGTDANIASGFSGICGFVHALANIELLRFNNWTGGNIQGLARTEKRRFPKFFMQEPLTPGRLV